MNSLDMREKLNGTLLMLGVALLGWLPFVISAWSKPYTPTFLVLVSFSVALLALGAVIESTELLMGKGRGIYTAAIFCTIPAVGAMISTSAFLPLMGLMLLVGVGIWMAAHARDDSRIYFLIMLAALLVAVGYLFSFYTGSFAMIFVIWMAVAEGKRGPAIFITAALLVLCFIFGSMARMFLEVGVPMLLESAESEGRGIAILYSMLPWVLFIVPALMAFAIRRTKISKLQIAAIVTVLVVYTMGWRTNTSLIILTGVTSPVLALLCSSLVSEAFLPVDQSSTRWMITLPAVLTALALAGFGAYCGLQPHSQFPFRVWQVVISVILLLGILLPLRKNLPRWVFFMLILSGILFGSLTYLYDEWPTLEDADHFEQLNLAQEFIPVYVFSGLAICVWMVVRFLYGKPIPKLVHDHLDYHYTEINARSYANLKRASWEGEPVSISDTSTYRFAIFGDITGAEFPFRSSGNTYRVFRALADQLKETEPLFAVSLGDLATKAAALPYRRIRKLLSHIPVPLMVIPGNHDLFLDERYLITYFHGLFGADNSCFQLGSCKFILLNNARGYVEEEQFAWLEKQLREGKSGYRVVFCHKPPFDFRPDKFYAMENREHAERLHQLFAAYNVTAVFSGHIHTLLSESRDGVMYIVTGGAGSKLTTKSDLHHYLEAEISPEEFILRALPLAARTAISSEPLLQLRFTPSPCTSADQKTFLSPHVS